MATGPAEPCATSTTCCRLDPEPGQPPRSEEHDRDGSVRARRLRTEHALQLAREAVELSAPGEHNIACAIAGDLAPRRGHDGEALAFFAKAIETFHWLGNRTGMGTVTQRVGVILADRDPEAAAVLLGAGDAHAPGYTHAPHMVEAERRTMATLDAALGAAHGGTDGAGRCHIGRRRRGDRPQHRRTDVLKRPGDIPSSHVGKGRCPAPRWVCALTRSGPIL